MSEREAGRYGKIHIMSTNGTSGWNRPSVNKAEEKKNGVKCQSSAKGIIVGLAIAVPVVALVIWFFSSGELATSDLQAARRSRIKEVTPAKGKSAEQERSAKGEVRRAAESAEKRTENGVPSEAKPYVPKGPVHTGGVARYTYLDRTFDHETDRMLASLLEVEPGDTFVGSSEQIYDGFKKEFLKALKEPIEYNKDDDLYTKELKIAVQQVRQELKERIDAGEDIEKVLAETRDQYQKLGQYRQELEDEVVGLSQKEDLTEEEYKDLLDAANKMLAEKGIKELSLPKTFKHRIILNNLKNTNGKKEETKNEQ